VIRMLRHECGWEARSVPAGAVPALEAAGFRLEGARLVLRVSRERAEAERRVRLAELELRAARAALAGVTSERGVR
jgi:hypothetical protein